VERSTLRRRAIQNQAGTRPSRLHSVGMTIDLYNVWVYCREEGREGEREKTSISKRASHVFLRHLSCSVPYRAWGVCGLWARGGRSIYKSSSCPRLPGSAQIAKVNSATVSGPILHDCKKQSFSVQVSATGSWEARHFYTVMLWVASSRPVWCWLLPPV
jgi:hypothetical protein